MTSRFAFSLLLLIGASSMGCGGAVQDDSPELSPSPPGPPPSGANGRTSNGQGSSGSDKTSPTPPPVPRTSCPSTSTPQEIVHACGLPTDVSVVAVTDAHVAIASRIDVYGDDEFWIHRLDRASSQVDLLLSGETRLTYRMQVNFVPSVDSLVWLGTTEDGIGAGIQTLGLTTRKRGIVANNWMGPNLVTSATQVYWDGYDGKSSGVFAAPLAGTSAPRRFFPDQGGTLTFAAAQGFVYYFASGASLTTDLYRRSESGGEPELLAMDLPNTSDLGHEAQYSALDEDGSVFYVLRHSGNESGFDVVHVHDGTKTTVASCVEKVPSTCPEPAWIQLHGDEVLVGRMPSMTDLEHWTGFVRLSKTPVGKLSGQDVAAATVAMNGTCLAPPIFEGERFWIGIHPDGDNEGRVVSRALPSKS